MLPSGENYMRSRGLSFNRGFWIFLIPGVLFFLVLIILPFVANIGISFTKWQGVGTPVWVGLDNFVKATKDAIFWASFRNNMSVILVMVSIPTFFGLVLATVLTDYIAKKFGKGVASFFRAGFYLPQIIPILVSAIVWRWILQPNWGVVNSVLKSIGLESLAHNWLGDSDTALLSVMVMLVWIQLGYPLIIFMAAMQRIDPELYEAAEIDGAGWSAKFTSITLPLIRPELFVVILTTTIYSLKLFAPVFAVTRGGPGSSTMLPSYFSYKNFFETSNVGYGATIATVLTFLVVVLTVLWIRVQTQQEQLENL
jgi:raffinose/stachyose/melibiose transport system permease protein